MSRHRLTGTIRKEVVANRNCVAEHAKCFLLQGRSVQISEVRELCEQILRGTETVRNSHTVLHDLVWASGFNNQQTRLLNNGTKEVFVLSNQTFVVDLQNDLKR